MLDYCAKKLYNIIKGNTLGEAAKENVKKMEKYGTIPPRFTRAWWSYFWEYYKWHTIAAVGAAAVIGITVYQCATRTEYDLSVVGAGEVRLTEEMSDKLCEDLGGIISDSDANGETNVFMQQLAIGDGQVDAEYEMAMTTKLTLEFSAGESFIFIMSKDLADQYLSNESMDGLFSPVEEWADEMPENVSMAHGIAYGVDLSQSAYFAGIGADMTDCRLMLRAPRYNETDDEKMMIQYENAKRAANYLIAK